MNVGENWEYANYVYVYIKENMQIFSSIATFANLLPVNSKSEVCT
jgi:hypothetical protein